MQYIGDMQQCVVGNAYSGLKVCALIAAKVDHRSTGKRLKLKEQVTRQRPIVDARDVRERLIEFDSLLSQCKKHNLQISTDDIYMGLERMVEKLLERNSLNILLAGVQHVVATSRGDGDAMYDALVNAAGDLAELESNRALPFHNHKQKTEGQPKGAINAM